MTQMRDAKGKFMSGKVTTEINSNTTTINNSNKEKENETMMKNAKEMRTMKLQEAGISTENFFDLSMRIPFGATVTINVNGKEMVVGQPISGNEGVVFNAEKSHALKDFANIMNAENDPIAQEIMEDGYVKNSKLFRRWITAHTFRMLNYQNYRKPNRKGWEACMKDCFGYNYQFTMLLEEIRVLSILQKEDPEAFEERTHFFNGNVVMVTLNDYRFRLQKYIKNVRRERPRNYRGDEYVKLARYGNVLVKDLNEKVYIEIQKRINAVQYYVDQNDYAGMYRALRAFMEKAYNKLPADTTKCAEWKDAFKASGSFYTLQNTIRFTGMVLEGCTNKYDSEQKLYGLLEEYKGEEWRLHKVLVDAIEYNHYNLAERIQMYKKEK